MTSDWWFLAMIGSAASAVGGALGTAATGALSTLGHLASGAASGIGTAASGALNAVTGGGGGGGAAAAAPAVTGGGGAGGVIPASEVASAGPTATSVATSNLPPAAGGQTITAPAVTAQPMSGNSILSGDPGQSMLAKVTGSSPSGAPGGTSAYGSGGPPLQAAAGPTPTLGNLTNVPELDQYGAGAAQHATPTTFAMSPAQSGVMPGGPSILDQVMGGAKNAAFGRFGVTNPNMGWGDIAKQAGLSQVAGGPFFGYNPQASFLSNLANAGGQRVLSSLFPGGGGQQPSNVQQAVQMMLATQGQPARQLPVYGNLPGYG
jgi:hypothetical protein